MKYFCFCLFLFSTLALGANVATIQFTGPTAYVDGTPILPTADKYYDLYQGLKGAPKVRVGTVIAGGQVTTGLLTGKEYCWHVVAVVDNVPSAPSNEACKNFVGLVPGTVTITVT